MASFLDFLNSPAGMGLLSGAASYAANARRGTPVNNVGRGLAGGLLGYQSAIDAQKAEQENAVARQYRQMQMDEMQNKMKQAQATQQWKAGLPDILKATKEQRSEFQADNPFGEDLGNLQSVTQVPDIQAQQEYLMRPESPYADKLIERQLFPAGDESFTLKPGEKRFRGSQVVAEVPDNEAVKVSQDMRDWLLSRGVDPNKATPDQYRQAYDAIDSSKTNRARLSGVNIGPTRIENITQQESEGSKVYGRGLGEMQVQIQKQGFTAPSKISNLDRMAQLLEGVDSGRLSGAGLEAARFAKSFGLNVDPKLGNKQAAEALAIEMALAMREPGSGPMTDKDFENYLNTVPSLAKTAEGRKEITATLKAKARRDIEIAKMTREYAKKNRGVIDDNFLDQVAEYMARNPVVPIARDYGGGWKMEKVK